LNGELYVESPREGELKGGILERLKGEKILLLTKHEFTDQPLPGMKPYGSLRDYSYVVVPKHNYQNKVKKKHDLIFERYQDLFCPEIIHWNYTILKVRKE